jgi:regulator of replication initiation timing
MKTETEKDQFLKKGLFWCLFHRKRVKKEIEEVRWENKRLQIENEHLVDHNRRIEDALRKKSLELKEHQKALKKLHEK